MNNANANGKQTTHKTGFKSPEPKIIKKMISEIRKGSKYIDPVTEEVVHVSYKDESCLGIGPSQGYITGYIRSGDIAWNTVVTLA